MIHPRPYWTFFLKRAPARALGYYSLRHYSILGSRIFKPKQYTKYRITSDFSSNSDYEDLYLAQPSRNDLVKTAKGESVFLRFLKLITDKEGRQEAFREFARRCESGLMVEKDAYITKAELLEALWENGYSELELNAFEIAFPADYQFHYPELAVLFCIDEADCYKYCMRRRAMKEDKLVEVLHKPTPSKVVSYGLLTSLIWFGLQNNVLGNMWMLVKTWPFFAVFYIVASHFQKSLMGKIHAESTKESQIAEENRLEGEDRVYLQMKKYSNDALCLDYLEAFKPGILSQIHDYRKAAFKQLTHLMDAKIVKHLLAVQQEEKAIELSLQSVIVTETMQAFQEAYDLNDAIKNSVFDAAVNAIATPNSLDAKDPVGDFFRTSFEDLSRSETPSSRTSPVATRVEAIFAAQERQFLDQFTITEQEAKAVSDMKASLSKQVGLDEKTGGLNLSSLPPEQLATVENLYRALTSKVGLGFISTRLNPFIPLESPDSDCRLFLNQVNSNVQSMEKKLQLRQVENFLQSF